MNNHLPLYGDIVPLDRGLHRDWRFQKIDDFSFARTLHAVLLLGSEFPQACHDYPIVFVREDKRVAPVALLGLREGENLFITEQGRWDARYLPAYLRRYPFVFAETAPDQLLLCIDAKCPNLHSGGESGEPLFETSGEPAPFVRNMLDFTQQFQLDYQRTLDFTSRLDQLGLFRDMTFNVGMAGAQGFAMSGFQIVDEEKLAKLEPAQVDTLFRGGLLGLVHAHLCSLVLANSLVQRLAPQPDPAAAKRR